MTAPADLPASLPAELAAELDDTGRVDLYCLRRAYPQLTGMTADAQGQWLVFADGRRVLYVAAPATSPPAGRNRNGW